MDMREYIKDQSNLALFYAEDGAYHSAARVLADLANAVKRHAMETDEALKQMQA